MLDHLSNLKKAPVKNLTVLDRKLLNQEKQANIWLVVAKAAHEENFQKAFQLALQHSDDIYLLRLMLLTGSMPKGLS